MKFILFQAVILFLLMGATASASEHHMIDTLGISTKGGQFVALEEYGYKAESHSYYVNIRIINVWTNQFEGAHIRIEESARRKSNLVSIRQKAKILARQQLIRYRIPVL